MSEEAQKKEKLLTLEKIEDQIVGLLVNAKEVTTLLSKIDAKNENKINKLVQQYYQSIQDIQMSITKEIDDCRRKPLLLPLLPIGHDNQYISEEATSIHKQILSKED